MPTTFFEGPSTIGRPEMLKRAMMSRASRIVAAGRSVTGSRITPFAERLTLSTSRTWASIDRLRWMTPMPPSRARETASFSSVTVSIAAEASGTLIGTSREKRVARRASRGTRSEWRGTSRTSSNVRPSGKAALIADLHAKKEGGAPWGKASVRSRRIQATPLGAGKRDPATTQVNCRAPRRRRCPSLRQGAAGP
jgi:hypothetical protein